MSPYETIKTASVNAAEALGKSEEFGTVTAGKRAGLLLVKGNPLDDIANLLKIKGVIIKGKWLPKYQLDKTIN